MFNLAIDVYIYQEYDKKKQQEMEKTSDCNTKLELSYL